MARQIKGAPRRVLVVDDHPLVRKALRELVCAQPDLVVCGETDNAPEAIQLVRDHRPHLAIVDLSLKSGSGLELIKQIRAWDKNVKVLVISVHEDAIFAPRALDAGALGYVNKGEPEDRILAAVRRVLQGKVALSDLIADHILRRFVGSHAAARTKIEKLSDREIEVLELIGQGHATRRIAEHLQLSVKTIETHREKLKLKLDLADGAALACYAAVWAHAQSRSNATGPSQAV
ncbi:MAG: response regulator [Planctomycetota bacterium]|jgi:DNA-binding NarL/FixJ family response regulator